MKRIDVYITGNLLETTQINKRAFKNGYNRGKKSNKNV